MKCATMKTGTIDTEKAIFVAGCFWGVEQFLHQVKGVVSTTVGYTGGHAENPTCKEVCGGDTGHAEAVEVFFNPAETSFETLAKLFFEMHNPALITNNSGKRSQYRSAIFYFSEEQKAAAEKLIQRLRDRKIDIRTERRLAGIFYRAEEYHQNDYTKKGQNVFVRRRTPKF